MGLVKKFKDTQGVWLRATIGLPKDHPQYQEQQDLQNIIVGAALGSVFIGLVIGLFFGWIIWAN
jgi:hypothetical protein